MSAFSNGAFGEDTAFSSDAFDFGSGPPPTPDDSPRPSGGIPASAYARGRTKEQERRSRVLHGIEKEVVSKVAERQAKALDLDDLQKKEELLAELNLRKIEVRAEHFEALAFEREALIEAEIAAYMEFLRKQDEDAIAFMIMAGSI